MEPIKPRITLPGYKKALQEYGPNPSRIVEELVANSYDADATVVLVVHSAHDLVVIDNGSGISDDQFPRLLDLGAGNKIGRHDSILKRSYLGSFGFGIKATINIAKSIKIYTTNKYNQLSCEIDVGELESQGFKDGWSGFPVGELKRPKAAPTGTVVCLTLKNDLTPDDVDAIRDSLYNLPKAKDFSMFLAASKKVGKTFLSPGQPSIAALRTTATQLKKNRISGTLDIGKPSIVKVKLLGADTMDIAVWCKGLDSNMKVPSLGQFAGVYVKVDGRVLKKNFQGEKALDGVSKYPKFRHGMRVEVPIDWVKEHISLGRDGVQFGNDSSKKKFEAEIKVALTAAVRPFAKQLEDRKHKRVSKEVDLRLRRARDRIAKKQQIKSLVGTGYSFIPSDDYEMALFIANPLVMKKLSPSWLLMDFNGQLDFDCLVFDRTTTNYYKIELEPRLDSFLTQGVPDNTDYIITWTKGDWKVGKGRKGKKGFYELVETSDKLGHYKLLIKSSSKSREPKQVLPVFCLDKALSV